jgi:hypothetical protein
MPSAVALTQELVHFNTCAQHFGALLENSGLCG